MLLRVCLIVAVLAALGGLGLSFKVSERIKGVTEERNSAVTARQQAETRATAAQKEAREAKKRAEDALAELDTTKTNLFVATAELEKQSALARDLSVDLEKVRKDYQEADNQLAKWNALKIAPDKIRELQDTLRTTIEERDAFEKEKDILSRNIARLENRLTLYERPNMEVKLPSVKGKILAVDPKHGFVVVNLGTEQGLLDQGKLVVTRQGKVIGKVRLARLEGGQSVANIIPGWSQSEILEGDEVMTSYEALARQ